MYEIYSPKRKSIYLPFLDSDRYSAPTESIITYIIPSYNS